MGTGLGLSQVFGFAKQSGGEVRVITEVGRGSTLTLYLARVAGASLVRDAEPAPLPEGHGTRVLVVEDNADVGAFTVQTLTELGYQTRWALNAEEALQALQAAGGGFDVVFSDVMMPGLDGVELARRSAAVMPVFRLCLPVVTATSLPGTAPTALNCCTSRIPSTSCRTYCARPLCRACASPKK